MKACIIGLGMQGMRYYQALKELGTELVCVVDVCPEVVQKRVPEYPLDRIYTNVPDAFKAHQPDVVIIATHSAARIQSVRDTLAAGVKKIFLEKPMATTYQDCLEIKRLTEQAGCLFVVNHLRRFNPNYHQLKEVIDRGVIGKVEHMYAQVGAVGLGTEGTHIIDKMRFLTESEIAWVIGFLDTTGTPNPRGPQYKDPGGWGMMQFEDGTRAFIDTCEDTGVPSVLEIVGTYGRIIIEELNNHWAILARSQDDRKLPLTKILTPLKSVPVFSTLPWDVKEFTKMGLKELIFEDKVSCSVDDGCRAIEAIMALHASHIQGGKKIDLPLAEKYHTLEVAWA